MVTHPPCRHITPAGLSLHALQGVPSLRTHGGAAPSTAGIACIASESSSDEAASGVGSDGGSGGVAAARVPRTSGTTGKAMTWRGGIAGALPALERAYMAGLVLVWLYTQLVHGAVFR